jgi:hypothetical protein
LGWAHGTNYAAFANGVDFRRQLASAREEQLPVAGWPLMAVFRKFNLLGSKKLV